MIQALKLIGKNYFELKDLLVGNPLKKEPFDILSKIGLVPQLDEFTLKEDLYFFDIELTDYKIRFIDNFVFDILPSFKRSTSMECIKFLIENKDFTFNFFTHDFLEDFCNKNRLEDGSYPDWDVVLPEFDESWIFDIENIQQYEALEFFDDNIKIEVNIMKPFDLLLFSWSIKNRKVRYNVDKVDYLSSQN